MFKKVTAGLFIYLFTHSFVYADITLSKIRLVYEKNRTTENLTLKNTVSSEPKAFELSIKKWNQLADSSEKSKDKAGLQDVFTETDDITVAPETLILKPNEEKTIRLIVNDRDKAKEQYSYRLFINEIPIKDPNNQTKSAQILFTYQMILPVFVYPDEAKSLDKINTNIKFLKEKDQNFILFANNDSEHVQVKEIIVGDTRYSFNQYVLSKQSAKIDIKHIEIGSFKTIKIVTDKGFYDLTL